MKDERIPLSNNADIEELHNRKYLIYDTEAEAMEALRELHENQYMILEEDELCEMKEEFNDAFSKIASYISLVPPATNTNPFSVSKKKVPECILGKTKDKKKNDVIADDGKNTSKSIIHTLYINKELNGGRECHATATYNSVTKEVIIKQGSILALTPAPHYLLSPQGLARRVFVDMNCELKSFGYVLKKDTPCRSLSTAACFILGRSANAMIEWNDESGIPLQNVKFVK